MFGVFVYQYPSKESILDIDQSFNPKSF